MSLRQSLGHLALILFVLLVVCAVKGDDGTNFPMTITDSAGRDVIIPMPVQRIIVLNTDAAEALTILGAANKVVGIVDTIQMKTEYFPELSNKQYVGKFSGPDYEMIGEIAKEGDTIVPDILVIGYPDANKPYGAAEVAKNLAAFKNITMIGLDFDDPETISEVMTKLGTILGKEKEAKNYLDWHAEKRSQVEQAVTDMQRPRVYYELSSTGGIGALQTYGTEDGLNNLGRIAGGINIAGNLKEQNPKVNWEWVCSQNPDIIIKVKIQVPLGWENGPSKDTIDLENLQNEILDRPGSKNINAVKNNRVYTLYRGMCYGTDNFVGMTYLAKLFHPEADLNPDEVYGEYLKKIDLEMPEDRIFFYPSLELNS